MVATKKHLNKGVRGDRKVCVWKGGQALGVDQKVRDKPLQWTGKW